MRTAEQVMLDTIGDKAGNISINMINVNSSSLQGTDDTNISCIKFINACDNYHTELMKVYREDSKKGKQDFDKYFVPMWFSPSSFKSLTHPIAFGGNVTVEKSAKELNLYASHQILPVWDNSNICSVLASKICFDSMGVDAPTTFGPLDEGYGTKETEYCKNRGLFLENGVKSKDSIRFIASYKTSSNKSVISLICGSHNFLRGSSDIFKSLKEYSDFLKVNQENKKRQGIDLADVSISKKTDGENYSIAFSRLIGGAIYTHDYLCILKNIYGVKSIMSIDNTLKIKTKKIKIDEVITDLAQVKKYYALNKALNFIK